MRYEPHEYQTYATEFIIDHPEAAVFLQMGLGKSVITLTAIRRLIEAGEIHRVLVIAPLRVARDTWPDEIRKWDHLSGMTYAVAVGTERERREALSRDAQLHIINRENVPWMVKNLPFEYDMIVIDELSSFKNWQASRFRALMAVRPRVKRIVGLTGTPTSNGLMDLFAEFRVLDMGKRLGRYISQYRAEFFEPDRQSWQQVFTWKPRPGAEEAIYERIGDMTVSMKSADYIRMPERVENTVTVRLNAAERAAYEEMKEEMILRLAGETIDAKNAASLCGKLSQMANGAVYTEHGESIRIHDRKLDALEDLIEGANGNPMLVAYWYRQDLERIRKRFPEARPLATSADMADWNAGRIPVGLIHPASAGHGLNLQAGGSTLVWFGLTWSLELYQQTKARLWRQGQKAETVVIHHIVTEQTIDGQILAALERKDRTQAALIEAVKAEMGGDQPDRKGISGTGVPA